MTDTAVIVTPASCHILTLPVKGTVSRPSKGLYAAHRAECFTAERSPALGSLVRAVSLAKSIQGGQDNTIPAGISAFLEDIDDGACAKDACTCLPESNSDWNKNGLQWMILI
jgi:hypothetical protein